MAADQQDVRIRAEPEAGFAPLFDGESLEGWTQPADGWKVQDGCLVAEDEKAWLLTSAGEYGDYVLRLRYRVAEGASGAVHLRDVGGERNRVQIAVADDWGDPPSMTGSGALRGFGAPRVNASLPAGEWNDLEITYRGGEIAVRLNALPVTDGSIFWYSGWYRAPVRGRISLQPYGGRVEFRDVRIRELPTEATEPL